MAKAKVITDKCVGCGACEAMCPTGAIKIIDGKAEVNQSVCVGCGACASACPVEAIEVK